MELTHYGGYRLQPRINLGREVTPIPPDSTEKPPTGVFHRLFARSSEDKCKETPDSNTCEKPVGGNLTVPIVVTIVGALVLIAGVLFYLHRRNVKRSRLEDARDPHKSLDFGLGDQKKSARRSIFMGGGGEKGLHHKQSQLSMDMNLSSPYLLPPGLQQSRESLHSLARSLGNDSQDPYHNRTSVGKDPSQRMPPSRMNSLPETPISATDSKVDPFATPKMPEPTHLQNSPVESEKPKIHTASIVPEIGVISDFDEKHDSSLVQQPPVARTKSPEFELPSFAQTTDNAQPANNAFTLPANKDNEPAGLGLNFGFPKPTSPTVDDAPRSAPLPSQDRHSDGSNYQAYQPAVDIADYYGDDDDEGRGRTMQRKSFLPDQSQPQGLGVPQQDNKRLSVGFRPLPPDEITESEDPEYRANRIRSFYKEYFEDTQAPPPMPPMPPMQRGNGGHGQYYDDNNNQGNLGEAAAYFDPETNAFVMPYAQPVTRRAMTPPPAGRFRGGPGPRGPRGPHGPHGSIGGMSAHSGPRGGRSRAGSALGPRPDSSASARFRQPPPMKRLPPPAPLSTLPAPSKLKDDNFAIINAADFAPPDRIRDNVAGRSQSPFGERRPYSPTVPAAVPLVGAFDELTALPSPHLLRKSSTFTGLDFAPPKKFKDADTMSDAGSIRSNKSGMSQAQLGALRAGAGRVSRLPGDTVFTQASMQDTLKPSWTLRP
ncbi:hypothetical protein BHE90_011342 [Fusarium euwallaceae]|uniref:Uncharacterized protein n=5 Tax=Fusarium solani species complex TaxID=232080 RepID=A0A3M2S2Y7_9HYPO|nr:hypothetical protein CDV36_008437 [Fusarium kuroshium]RSL88171.1 hypothetical protein CEP51_001860 [Fusarium floridanum]RSM05770.1 hypothetical protein CEP52_006050 [Fusarium oligoseptatum]RSM10237.1 hypothetical protein CDV31_007314 [Fusarium ambrosium]RTE74227.1 hypothetical protein BHE90_011342 [Fusarium euwallaceae]